MEISVTNIAQEFKAFIDEDYNKRILFSGRFGSGKTYFLHKFFDEQKVNTANEQLSESYLPIYIYPVNYSVASNDDIFKLIKYDILHEFLKHPQKFILDDTVYVNLFTSMAFLGAKEQKEIFKHVLSMIPKVGKSILEIVEPVDKILGILKDNQAKINTKNSDRIKLFAENIEATVALYENDFITQLIQIYITQAQAKGAKVVLVIDDLDRIDPEHIFRILNVFAAHFDYQKYTYSSKSNNEVAPDNETILDNKFGFDKVLVSCDIENIQEIFAHKYGANTDFGGYIKKFVSSQVFKFDNFTAILNELEKLLNNIKVAEDHMALGNFINKKNNIYYKYFYILIKAFVASNMLTLRTIIEIEKINIKHRYGNIRYNIAFGYVFLDFLLYIYGSEQAVLSVISKTSFKDIERQINETRNLQSDLLANFMCFFDFEEVLTTQIPEQIKTYKYKNFEINTKLMIKSNSYISSVEFEGSALIRPQYGNNPFNIFGEVMEEAFKVFTKIQIK